MVRKGSLGRKKRQKQDRNDISLFRQFLSLLSFFVWILWSQVCPFAGIWVNEGAAKKPLGSPNMAESSGDSEVGALKGEVGHDEAKMR